MTVTIDYGMNIEPETIRHVVSIEEDTGYVDQRGVKLFIMYHDTNENIACTKTRMIRYTEYVTITIH